ncbi:MAG: serine hydrolase [Candidatus Aminicenantes bacterium]|nr:serine hydrolase [Candidatus Aminicenantes bacterium]
MNTFKKNLIFTLTLLFLFSQIYAQDKLTEKLDEVIDKAVELDMFSGCILVAKEDKILYTKATGEANKDFHIQNTLDTKFNIASGTKPFTSTSIMLLVQKGLISVNDSVTKYLPDFPFGDKITIFHLLTHTSGLGPYTREYSERMHNIRGFEDFLNLFVYKEKLSFEPGTKFSYSNSGVIVLGAIIEKVSGLKYAEFLRQNIFIPLNMTNTASIMPEEVITKRASGYIRKITGGFFETSLQVCPPTSATGLRTTVTDLFKFIQAVHNDKLLKKEYKEMMFTPYLSDDLGPYAFLWDVLDGCIYTDCKGAVIGHRGGQPGFETLYYYYLNEKYTIILLSNYSNSRRIYPMIEAIVFGNDYTLPKLPVEIELYSWMKKMGSEYVIQNIDNLLNDNNYTISNSRILNSAGYDLINEGELDYATACFILNVKLFKDDANAYDSLGEAYMKNGQKDLAIKNYEKSLELNPENNNAKEMLDKLKNNG